MARLYSVVFDSNFLLIPFQFNIDIFSEVRNIVPKSRFIVLKPIVQELDNIRYGNAAKELIRKRKIKIIPYKGFADKAIIEYSSKKKCVVCTNDKNLIKRLRKLHVPVIYLRGKKKLGLQGYIC